MNRREKLIDNYEDALFAVLMDKVAEEEGAKLREENQRLQNNPEAAVPEHVDAVARQTIRKAFAGQNRRSVLHVAKRVLSTVAMIVLICSALFATAYAAFPEVRVQTLNLLIQSSDVASRLVLLNEGELSGEQTENEENQLLCGYSLPTMNGFTVAERNEDKHGGWIKYETSDSVSVQISITLGGTEYIDTENADLIEEIIIHDYSGMMIKKGHRVTYHWSEADHGTYITMICTNLSSEVALQMAAQITYIGA